jgi:hypothetical protein
MVRDVVMGLPLLCRVVPTMANDDKGSAAREKGGYAHATGTSRLNAAPLGG